MELRQTGEVVVCLPNLGQGDSLPIIRQTSSLLGATGRRLFDEHLEGGNELPSE